MAKSKSSAKTIDTEPVAPRKVGRPRKEHPEPDVPRKVGRPKVKPLFAPPLGTITMKATPEWFEWLDGLAIAASPKFLKLNRSDVIEMALAKLASEIQYPEPPNRTSGE